MSASQLHALKITLKGTEVHQGTEVHPVGVGNLCYKHHLTNRGEQRKNASSSHWGSRYSLCQNVFSPQFKTGNGGVPLLQEAGPEGTPDGIPGTVAGSDHPSWPTCGPFILGPPPRPGLGGDAS